MDPTHEATERFAALLSLPEPDLPLDEAALLLSAHASPGLEIEPWLIRLDDLAARVADARDAAELGRALFETEGFVGNATDYDDPRNSLLDEVLERRLGIPISLSVIAIEVGRRIGVGLHGVGMPGHFLVGVSGEPGRFLDPFHGGHLLDEDGCAATFSALHGPTARWSVEYLAPTGPRAILVRMLNNLAQSYAHRGARDGVWVARLRLRFPELGVVGLHRSAAMLGSLGGFVEAADALEALARDAGEPEAERLVAEAAALRARTN